MISARVRKKSGGCRLTLFFFSWDFSHSLLLLVFVVSSKTPRVELLPVCSRNDWWCGFEEKNDGISWDEERGSPNKNSQQRPKIKREREREGRNKQTKKVCSSSHVKILFVPILLITKQQVNKTGLTTTESTTTTTTAATLDLFLRRCVMH